MNCADEAVAPTPHAGSAPHVTQAPVTVAPSKNLRLEIAID
jgi:hypothetical protein